jgi:hypothetical protein
MVLDPYAAALIDSPDRISAGGRQIRNFFQRRSLHKAILEWKR